MGTFNFLWRTPTEIFWYGQFVSKGGGVVSFAEKTAGRIRKFEKNWKNLCSFLLGLEWLKCCMKGRIINIWEKIVGWPSKQGNGGFTTSEPDRLSEI